MEAYDSAYRQNRAVKYIGIKVNRNANTPRFPKTIYEKTVSDDFPLVTEVIQFNAIDDDGVNY